MRKSHAFYRVQLNVLMCAKRLYRTCYVLNGKMVNGFRYYRALESVSIASALFTALTIYPCQIRVHQRWQSKLQLPYSSEEGLAAGHSGQFTPMRLPVNTVIHTTLVSLEPATFRSLVRRATSSATEPTNRSDAVMNPLHDVQAYSSFVATTDRNTVWRQSSVRP